MSAAKDKGTSKRGPQKNPRKKKPALDRLMSKVVKQDDGCWVWQGGTNDGGYGRIGMWQPNGRMTNSAVHRVSYELHVGPIPDGLQIDHLCNVRTCVNPEHLEPVTGKENNRRAKALITECPQGHPYSEENTRLKTLRGVTRRHCITCINIYNAKYRARKKAELING